MAGGGSSMSSASQVAISLMSVARWLHGGKSIELIVRELGSSTQSLKQWKKQLATLPTTGPEAAFGQPCGQRRVPGRSRSRRGNCYNNAVRESFWSSLKRELIRRGQLPAEVYPEWENPGNESN